MSAQPKFAYVVNQSAQESVRGAGPRSDCRSFPELVRHLHNLDSTLCVTPREVRPSSEEAR